MTSNKFGVAIALVLSMGLAACGGGTKTPRHPSSSSSSFSSASLVSSSSVSTAELSSSSKSSQIVSTSSSSSLVQSSSSSSEEQSSSSSSSVPVVQTYKVTIETSNFYASKISFSLFPKAYAAAFVSPDRFSLARVDADGVVVELLPLTPADISLISSTRFEITAPVAPSLDHILLFRGEDDEALGVGDSIFGAGVLAAPFTASAFTVDMVATAAYQAFLENLPGSFDAINSSDEGVLSAFNDVADVIRDRIPNAQGDNLNERVAFIVAEQSSVVAALVASLSTPSTQTLESVTLANGVHWFMNEEDEFIHRVYNSNGEMRTYRGTHTESAEGVHWEDFMEDKIFSLTDSGWTLVPDVLDIAGFSDAGKSMLLNFAGSSSVRIEQNFVHKVANQSLQKTLEQVPVFNDVIKYVNGSASSVATDEKDVLIVATAYATADTYDMWFSEEIDDKGECWSGGTLESRNGNCDVVTGFVAVEDFPEYLTGVSGITEFARVINPVDSEFSEKMFIAAGWAYDDVLLLSLNSDNTVDYYVYDQYDYNYSKTALERMTSLGSGTWTKVVHPSGVELIEFILPQEALEREFADEKNRFITFHDGFVRSGEKTVQGDVLARNLVFTSDAFAQKFLNQLQEAD